MNLAFEYIDAMFEITRDRARKYEEQCQKGMLTYSEYQDLTKSIYTTFSDFVKKITE